jgi:hypothetical protein
MTNGGGVRKSVSLRKTPQEPPKGGMDLFARSGNWFAADIVREAIPKGPVSDEKVAELFGLVRKVEAAELPADDRELLRKIGSFGQKDAWSAQRAINVMMRYQRDPKAINLDFQCRLLEAWYNDAMGQLVREERERMITTPMTPKVRNLVLKMLDASLGKDGYAMLTAVDRARTYLVSPEAKKGDTGMLDATIEVLDAWRTTG